MVKHCTNLTSSEATYYYCSEDCYPADGSVYNEFQNDRCTRQINIVDGIAHIPYSWGGDLSDHMAAMYLGSVNELDLTDSTLITKKEFEIAWKKYAANYLVNARILYQYGDAVKHLKKKMLIIHIADNEGRWEKGVVGSLTENLPGITEECSQWYHDKNFIALGDVQFLACDEENGTFIANMAAQNGTKQNHNDTNDYINYPALRECLIKARIFALTNHLSIQIPKIGSGLAGGDWNRIEQLIVDELLYYKIACTVLLFR